MLVQHGLVVAAPDRPVLAGSAAVDGLHAASMLAVAATSARHRRVALISAGIARAGALAPLPGIPPRGPPPPPPPVRAPLLGPTVPPPPGDPRGADPRERD